MYPIAIQTVIVSLEFCCYCYLSGNRSFIFLYNNRYEHSEFIFWYVTKFHKWKYTKMLDTSKRGRYIHFNFVICVWYIFGQWALESFAYGDSAGMSLFAWPIRLSKVYHVCTANVVLFLIASSSNKHDDIFPPFVFALL